MWLIIYRCCNSGPKLEYKWIIGTWSHWNTGISHGLLHHLGQQTLNLISYTYFQISTVNHESSHGMGIVPNQKDTWNEKIWCTILLDVLMRYSSSLNFPFVKFFSWMDFSYKNPSNEHCLIVSKLYNWDKKHLIVSNEKIN